MGRPADPFRVKMRSLMADSMSDRTFARYWRAYGILRELCSTGDVEAAIREATRPNGSFNVSKFERIADRAIMTALGDV